MLTIYLNNKRISTTTSNSCGIYKLIMANKPLKNLIFIIKYMLIIT